MKIKELIDKAKHYNTKHIYVENQDNGNFTLFFEIVNNLHIKNNKTINQFPVILVTKCYLSNSWLRNKRNSHSGCR